MFANHKKAKNIHTVPSLNWRSMILPVCALYLHPVRLCCYTRWKPDGSLLYGRRCQVLPSCFEFRQFGDNLWWVYFHKSTFSHQTSTEPSTPLPSKKKFFSSFVYGQLQTVCDCATTGANPGQTPSPWWNNPTLLWQRLPEEALYQWVCPAHLHWLKQKPNPLQFSH